MDGIMTEFTPAEVMQKLADGISADRWQDLHMLYATDTVVRHPIARDRSARLEGREALKDHFERFFATGVKLRATPIRFIETTDPELIVGTFTYHGENGFGMERFDLEACFIWRVRDGLVVDSNDYLSPPVRPRD
jgi:ketosteroid isomerase-like protein